MEVIEENKKLECHNCHCILSFTSKDIYIQVDIIILHILAAQFAVLEYMNIMNVTNYIIKKTNEL